MENHTGDMIRPYYDIGEKGWILNNRQMARYRAISTARYLVMVGYSSCHFNIVNICGDDLMTTHLDQYTGRC